MTFLSDHTQAKGGGRVTKGSVNHCRDAKRDLVLERPRNDLHADGQALRRSANRDDSRGAASTLNHCVWRTASRYSTVWPSITQLRSPWRNAGMLATGQSRTG